MDNSNGGDPSKGSVGATGELDAVVIHRDGSRENIEPQSILAKAGAAIKAGLQSLFGGSK